jgi:CxxC-x17-CxxC domain-containing protein
MHPAECSVCGKKTYVPFKPEEGRSIFCKTHRSSGERPVSPASLPRSAGPTPPVSPAKPAAISSVPPAKPVASVPTVAQPSVVPAQKQTLQAPQISQDKKPVFVRPTTRPSSPKPSFPQNKGRIIPQRKTISLNQLNDKKTFQPRMDELRKVLDEVMAGKGKEKTEIVATPTKPIQDISNKKTGVLKPGESVKINNQ